MLLTGICVWIQLRDKNKSKASASPKPTLVWATAHRSWKPGAHCTTHRQFKRVSFPRNLSSVQFQADQLVLECLTAVITAYIFVWKEGPCESGQFQGFLEAALNCLLPELKEHPRRIHCLSFPQSILLFISHLTSCVLISFLPKRIVLSRRKLLHSRRVTERNRNTLHQLEVPMGLH